MPSTAEKLARKNQEGLSLLLKLLAQLGMSYKEIAEVLGVSPSLITVICQVGLPLCHERFAIGPSRDQEGLLGAAP